jgi:hypothetical protein
MEGNIITTFYELGIEAILTLAMVIATTSGVFFTIYKYFISQRENRKLQFVNQIENFERQFRQIGENYAQAKPKKYVDCLKCSDHNLVLIDRISYLKEKGMIDQDTVGYFRFWFAVAEACFEWQENIESRKLKNNFPYFNTVKSTIEYPKYELDGFFQGYLNLKNENPDIDLKQLSLHEQKYGKSILKELHYLDDKEDIDWSGFENKQQEKI